MEAPRTCQSFGPCLLLSPQHANGVMFQSTTKLDLKLLSSPRSCCNLGDLPKMQTWHHSSAQNLQRPSPSEWRPTRLKGLQDPSCLPGLSLLPHLIIQQIFIEWLFYAWQSEYGSARGRQKSPPSWKLHIHSTEREEVISKWNISYFWRWFVI